MELTCSAQSSVIYSQSQKLISSKKQPHRNLQNNVGGNIGTPGLREVDTQQETITPVCMLCLQRSVNNDQGTVWVVPQVPITHHPPFNESTVRLVF